MYIFSTRTGEEMYQIYRDFKRRKEYSKNDKVGKLFKQNYQIDNSEDTSEWAEIAFITFANE